MEYCKLWRISVFLTISLQCLAPSVAQAEDECSSRCWNPVQLNYGVEEDIIQEDIFTEDDCKALCLNSETCIGINFDKNYNRCWLQTTPYPLRFMPYINHWSVANCTDDCAPYCWTRVPIGEHTSPGYIQLGVADENHCKLLCSKAPNCTGIEWTRNCYLLDPQFSLATYPGERHWEIERNQPTICQIMDGCSPRCWNPVQEDYGVDATTEQTGVASEEDCKALCLNGETCIGIDWDKNNSECWFQTTPSSPSYSPNVNHWSVANCTDDCAPYCWRLVQIGEHTTPSYHVPGVKDETHCKLLCSNSSNCFAIDWTGNCYLMDPTEVFATYSGNRHWEIERKLLTNCQG